MGWPINSVRPFIKQYRSTVRYKKFVDWLSERNLAKDHGEFLLLGPSESVTLMGSATHLSFLNDAFELGGKYGHKTINIDCGIIQRNGGSSQLEVAYLLAQSVYIINHFLAKGITDNIANRLFISTSVGSNYFLELSKIQFIRILINQLLKKYGVVNSYVPILAMTSPLTKSVLDKNTNFLRCTSESMSAVLGGTDYLTIMPFHDLKSTDRIARNISNLLKDESYLAKVEYPSAGSYYLENLSQELGRLAWHAFQKIEGRGSFQLAIQEGFFN